MTSPFLHAYCQLLVKTCHRRNAVRDGRDGRADPDQGRRGRRTRAAMAKVRADKEREATDGFRRHMGRASGAWCRSPGRSSIAFMPQANQVDRKARGREGEGFRPAGIRAAGADHRTGAGAHPTSNVSPAVTSARGWAATAAYRSTTSLEDAATAEISRLAAVAVDPPIRKERSRMAAGSRSRCSARCWGRS